VAYTVPVERDSLNQVYLIRFSLFCMTVLYHRGVTR
jgi:hypothetical protein